MSPVTLGEDTSMMTQTRSLTDHFSLEEVACKCGCGFADFDIRQLGALEFLRGIIGTPIAVSSFCRCPAHNKAVGGRPHSQHLLGRATDISVAGMATGELARLCEEVPCWRRGGIGIYNTFVHVDCRGYTARWDER